MCFLCFFCFCVFYVFWCVLCVWAKLPEIKLDDDDDSEGLWIMGHGSCESWLTGKLPDGSRVTIFDQLSALILLRLVASLYSELVTGHGFTPSCN